MLSHIMNIPSSSSLRKSQHLTVGHCSKVDFEWQTGTIVERLVKHHPAKNLGCR
jgi:hypothetical protein